MHMITTMIIFGLSHLVTDSGATKILEPFRTAFILDRDKWDVNWSWAQQICRKNYTDLVTIYDDKDNCELSGLGGFIGLEKKTNQIYKWSNGEAYRFNKSKEQNEHCYIMETNGAWKSDQCNNNYPFVCYSDESFSSFNYHFYNEPKNWKDALKFCRKNHTDLVSIANEAENSAVLSKADKQPVWIGLRSDVWEWSDGGGSIFMGNWSDENWGDEKFAAVGKSAEQWDLVAAAVLKPPICYKAHIHISEKRMTWEESLDYCANYRGLLFIETAKHQRVVEAFLKTVDNGTGIDEPVWVGLFQNSLMGFWVWTRGDTVRWSYWQDRKKPSTPLSHQCGVVQTKDHHFWWTDKNCLTKLRALCHYPPSKWPH